MSANRNLASIKAKRLARGPRVEAKRKLPRRLAAVPLTLLAIERHYAYHYDRCESACDTRTCPMPETGRMVRDDDDR